jgi:tetratricopeptide (TPR) repeat protein
MPRVALVSAMLAVVAAANGAIVPAQDVPQNQSATVIGPTNPQLSEGAAALDAGRVEEGIRLTLEGLKLPAEVRDKAAAYSNLCAGYAMLKKWDEALGYCNTSLSMDRNNWRTFNNRAAVYVGKGEYEHAMADLRAGLEIAPNSHKRLYGVRSRSAVRSP